MSLTEPEIKEPDIGSPDDHAHYARKEEISRAAVEGGFITALCGVKFMPLRNPDDYPTCQRCAALLEQFDQRNSS